MMDFNVEELLISLRAMENSDEEEFTENGVVENGHSITRHHASYQPCPNPSLSWLDLRVFYVRIRHCGINDGSTPEYLILNHVPFKRHVPLEANGIRAGVDSDDGSNLLKRVRLDRKSEEVAFVCTDSIRMMGGIKFEVFNGDVLVLFGTLRLSRGNGLFESYKNSGLSWSMNCESDFNGFFKGNQNRHKILESSIEVYAAGCFMGSPIVFSRTLRASPTRKQLGKGMLESIPECDAIESRKGESSSLAIQSKHHKAYEQEEENQCSSYQGMKYLEGEEDDGELSWFNAGVRVGVGLGLTICVGVGIGVGLMVHMYQGTTRNFSRRLL